MNCCGYLRVLLEIADRQIDKSLDELLEEFNLTVSQQMKASTSSNQVGPLTLSLNNIVK